MVLNITKVKITIVESNSVNLVVTYFKDRNVKQSETRLEVAMLRKAT